MNNKNKILILLFSTLLTTLIIFIILFLNYKNESLELEKKVKNIDSLYNERSLSLKISNKTKDSLNSVLKVIEPYRPLTGAMFFRDSIMNSISFKPGQIVMLKPDSIKVVIEKVIIEGGKYEHSIKFDVIYKDRTHEIVNPDILFK